MSIHKTVAQLLLDEAKNVWGSEECMLEFCQTHMHLQTLDRTDHARIFVQRLLHRAWQAASQGLMVPSAYDNRKVMGELSLICTDPNLYSQIALNVQEPSLHFDSLKWETDKTAAMAEAEAWPTNPFKAKKASYNGEERWDRAVTFIKTNVPAAIGAPSFRITPLGSTPAMIDNYNLSTMGPYVDEYLLCSQPLIKQLFVQWEQAQTFLMQTEDGAFIFEGGDRPYRSKSGGEILADSIVSRKITSAVLGHAYLNDQVVGVVPRLKSVLILGTQDFLDEVSHALAEHLLLPFELRDRRAIAYATE